MGWLCECGVRHGEIFKTCPRKWVRKSWECAECGRRHFFSVGICTNNKEYKREYLKAYYNEEMKEKYKELTMSKSRAGSTHKKMVEDGESYTKFYEENLKK